MYWICNQLLPAHLAMWALLLQTRGCLKRWSDSLHSLVHSIHKGSAYEEITGWHQTLKEKAILQHDVQQCRQPGNALSFHQRSSFTCSPVYLVDKNAPGQYLKYLQHWRLRTGHKTGKAVIELLFKIANAESVSAASWREEEKSECPGKGGRGKKFIHKIQCRIECMKTLWEKGLCQGIWSEGKTTLKKKCEQKSWNTNTQSFWQQWKIHIKRYGDFHWEFLLLICH